MVTKDGTIAGLQRERIADWAVTGDPWRQDIRLTTLERTPPPAWCVEIVFGENHPSGRNPQFGATFDQFFRRGYAAATVDAGGEHVLTPEDVRAWLAAGRRGFGTVDYLFRRAS